MNNNSCILIISHLNEQFRIDTAINQIKLIRKNTDLPIVHVGNFPIPKEVQELCNYTFYDERNYLLEEPLVYWSLLGDDDILGKNIKLTKFGQFNHGFAVVFLILSGIKFCEMLGFNHVFQMHYDSFMDDQDFKYFLDKCESKNVFFEFREKSSEKSDYFTSAIFAVNIDDFKSTIEEDLKSRLITKNFDIYMSENYLSYMFREVNQDVKFTFTYLVTVDVWELFDKFVCIRDTCSVLTTVCDLVDCFYVEDMNKYFIVSMDERFSSMDKLIFEVNGEILYAIRTQQHSYKGWPNRAGFLINCYDGEYKLLDENGEIIDRFESNKDFRKNNIVTVNIDIEKDI